MELLRLYHTDDDVLVVRKADLVENNIDDNYFIVPKDEWLCEDDGIKIFHLFMTKVENNRVSLYLVCGEYPVIVDELPLSKRVEYIEV